MSPPSGLSPYVDNFSLEHDKGYVYRGKLIGGVVPAIRIAAVNAGVNSIRCKYVQCHKVQLGHKSIN